MYSEYVVVLNPAATGGGPAASTQWRAPVSTFSDLSTLAIPSSTPAPVEGETRVVLDLDEPFIYDSTADSWEPADSIVGPATLLGLHDTNVGSAVDGSSIIFDGNFWQSAFDPIQVGFSRGSSATNIWLRREDGVYSNLSPLVLTYPQKLIAISAASNDNDTWDAEVYKNSFVRAGGTPSDANKVAELQIAATNSARTTVSVDFVAGDEIGVYLRGTSVDNPTVSLWFVRNV